MKKNEKLENLNIDEYEYLNNKLKYILQEKVSDNYRNVTLKKEKEKKYNKYKTAKLRSNNKF